MSAEGKVAQRTSNLALLGRGASFMERHDKTTRKITQRPMFYVSFIIVVVHLSIYLCI